MGSCPRVSNFSAQQKQEARNRLPQKTDINHVYCVREEVVGSRFYFSRCVLMLAKVLCCKKVHEGICNGFIASGLQFSVHGDLHSLLDIEFSRSYSLKCDLPSSK